MSRVIALVAARNEEQRVASTIDAIRSIPEVDEVVVVDGSSGDATVAEARAAGARVIVAPASARGKGEALDGALDRLGACDVVLLLDADLGPSADGAPALLQPILEGRADLSIGVLPRQLAHGGFRLVKRTAGAAILGLSGFRATEPLSGQRAVRREVLESLRPLAPGFGVEVAMTIDAVRMGFRVVEVPVAMTHAATGRDLAGFLHRARQGWDLLRVAFPRLMQRR
ncbi:MAG: glycosyltransferase [Actinomycetota bacterium]|nr:glycosyltransferase [Actinomycetota bacterium]